MNYNDFLVEKAKGSHENACSINTVQLTHISGLAIAAALNHGACPTFAPLSRNRA